MDNSITNVSNTVGFVDLDDLESESVTLLSMDLLEDVVQAAKVLDHGRFSSARIHLVHAPEDPESNPAVAISTDHSDPTAVMVASQEERGEDGAD